MRFKDLEHSIRVASAAQFSFYLSVHFVHFNIIGPTFYSLHKLTDKIWHDAIEGFDGISEEIRALDLFAPASLKDFFSLSPIPDMQEVDDAPVMVKRILENAEILVKALSDANTLAEEHPGLQNFLQERIDITEKFAWMLRATVQELV